MYGVALAAALFPASQSLAQAYQARDAGDWTVTASKDAKGCFLTREYRGPGGTTLLLGLDTDDSNRLTILNSNWSIKEKDRLKLNFRLSNGSFPKHLGIGMAASGKKGFVASFGATFPAHFAASKFLHISLGDVPVERLSLDGSGAAVAELRRCVGVFRGRPAAAAAGERVGADHIPTDPFAPDAGRRAEKKRTRAR